LEKTVTFYFIVSEDKIRMYESYSVDINMKSKTEDEFIIQQWCNLRCKTSELFIERSWEFVQSVKIYFSFIIISKERIYDKNYNLSLFHSLWASIKWHRRNINSSSFLLFWLRIRFQYFADVVIHNCFYFEIKTTPIDKIRFAFYHESQIKWHIRCII